MSIQEPPEESIHPAISIQEPPEESIPAPFICDCEEHMRQACASEGFYKKKEGKRYCVMHYPGDEKAAAFRTAHNNKLSAKNYNFRGVWFPKGVRFKVLLWGEDTDFSSASFNEDIDFSGTDFRVKALFNGARFNASVDFSKVSFRVGADFSGARFDKGTSFNDAHFFKSADFSAASFCADADFSSAGFGQAGGDFTYTNFGGNADFTRARFGKNADFVHASFGKNADFVHASFSKDFGGYADFTSASFNGEADFQFSNFNGEADFKAASFSEDANFSFSSFGKDADFSTDSFSKDVVFRSVTFGQVVDFRYASFSAGAFFINATFKDYVYFGGQPKGGAFSDQTQLSFQPTHIEKPDRVSFHTLDLKPHWFVEVDPRKFVFTNVEFKYDLKDELERLKKASVRAPHRLLSIACRHLADNAEANHRYHEASRLRYSSFDARRIERFRGFVPWRLDWWYWLASGYGENVLQAFIVFTLLVGVFTVGYKKVDFDPTNKTAITKPMPAAAGSSPDTLNTQPRRLGWRESLLYSFNVSILQKPEPKSIGLLGNLLVSLETVFGPAQAALLALALRRRFMR